VGGQALTDFSRRVIELVRRIPRGEVESYGGIAAAAGNPRAARQVARLLHSCSRAYGLPWHRVIGADGRLALPSGGGAELQRALLESEGVRFTPEGRVDRGSPGA
jgi:methylated-DNA-protein-cysteine methyltransferase-like protein